MNRREYTTPNTINSRQWRKLYKCKKGKGDHTFIVDHASYFEWRILGDKEESKNLYIESRCTTCGKLKIDFEKVL